MAAATGARVPTVCHIDRIGTLAPTAYMVMDFLPGERWEYLAHPGNPQTGPGEKKAIQREVGGLYARAHSRVYPARSASTETQALFWMLERLETAARRGQIDLDVAKLSRCRRVVEHERWLLPDSQDARDGVVSLCLVDSEAFFTRLLPPASSGDGCAWSLSFICDAEWVEFHDRYSDLMPLLCAPAASFREMDRPLLECTTAAAAAAAAGHDSGSSIAALPFFQGYSELRPLDIEKLSALPLYYHLGYWGNLLLAAQHSLQKLAWIRRCRGALIAEPVERMAAKAESVARPPRRRGYIPAATTAGVPASPSA